MVLHAMRNGLENATTDPRSSEQPTCMALTELIVVAAMCYDMSEMRVLVAVVAVD